MTKASLGPDRTGFHGWLGYPRYRSMQHDTVPTEACTNAAKREVLLVVGSFMVVSGGVPSLGSATAVVLRPFAFLARVVPRKPDNDGQWHGLAPKEDTSWTHYLDRQSCPVLLPLRMTVPGRTFERLCIHCHSLLRVPSLNSGVRSLASAPFACMQHAKVGPESLGGRLEAHVHYTGMQHSTKTGGVSCSIQQVRPILSREDQGR